MDFIKKDLAEGLREMTKMTIRDVRALGHDGMDASVGGASRAGYDYTYEIALVNRRIAKRLRLEEPGPWPFTEGFAKAPDHLRTIDALCAELQSACDDACEAIAAMPEDRWRHEYKMGDFSMTGFQIAVHAIDHTSYHLGQLNQMQLARGDSEVHWD